MSDIGSHANRAATFVDVIETVDKVIATAEASRNGEGLSQSPPERAPPPPARMLAGALGTRLSPTPISSRTQAHQIATRAQLGAHVASSNCHPSASQRPRCRLQSPPPRASSRSIISGKAPVSPVSHRRSMHAFELRSVRPVWSRALAPRAPNVCIR